MAIFKCKMCGGDLEINEGVTVCDCDYCGTKQTVPTAKDENLHGLYNRANTLRIKAEFDKAEQLYEKILQADESQAEAYWGLILCKYGIEYVEDPATFKRMPTCHRASFDSIIADEDYKSALKYADALQKSIYEQEAKEIDRIQKEIIELSSKEEPYDVFICYKETDETGSRTQDSVIANDIYYQLTQEGFKVFYAAITLEDKLGSAYEPCIFAALNSAKVMLSIGTKPEYFNAVWVKNEWSRYLKIMKKDRSRLLIPCYKDMDAYELPEEFAHLQAQDMGKIGFVNDIVRGISKVIVKEPQNTPTTVEITTPAVAPLLERIFLFLEDGDWTSANDYCEKVLDQEPKNAYAYLGKLMADLHIKKQDLLKNAAIPFDNSPNYQKVIRYGDKALISELNEHLESIKERVEKENKEKLYNKATADFQTNDPVRIKNAMENFTDLADYKDSKEKISLCQEKIKELEQKKLLEKARKKEIEAKQKEKAALKEKIPQLLQELIDFLRNGNIVVSEKKTLSDNIRANENKLSKLQKLKADWDRIDESAKIIEAKIKSLDAIITQKSEEKSKLGFFAGKQKKEIKIEIKSSQNELKNLNEKLSLEVEKKAGFQSLVSLNKKINEITIENEQLIKKLETLPNEKTCDTVRKELSSFSKKDIVGKTVQFGEYRLYRESDEYDIEWVVLDVRDGKVLLLTKEAIDLQAFYSGTPTDLRKIQWENSTVRKWLNTTFIQKAFKKLETNIISQETLIDEIVVTEYDDDGDEYEDYLTSESNDKIFLLSLDEFEKYVADDYDLKRCCATEYVSKKDSAPIRGEYCNWVLRTENETFRDHINYVDQYGKVSYWSKSEILCVRPALWIDIGLLK